MRLCLTADFHGMLPVVPECDLLIVAGDICPVYDHTLGFQRMWLKHDFTNWLDEVPAKRIIGIAGNHDFVAEADTQLMNRLPWTYLCNETVDGGGLSIYGTPLSNRFGPWAFMGEEFDLAQAYAEIPEDIDILVTHGPPYGAGDRVVNDRHDGDPHVGSRVLRETVVALQPRLVVTGHIHEGYGAYSVGHSDVWNASHVNEHYKPVNPVVEIEF